MATFGRARPAVSVPVVAWSCAIATALALATMVPVTSSANVTLLCRSTPYPRACETALTSAEARSARDPFAASVQFAMARATTARALARNLSASTAAPAAPAPSGMHDCAELLSISLAQLRDALAGSAADADGATSWLSAALTNQGTCRDSLAAVPLPDDPAGSDAVRRQVVALARFISTALALHVGKIKKGGSGGGGGVPSSTTSREERTAFPSWLSEHDRRLVESSSPAATNYDIVFSPDAVVALDGSGTHTSINQAIAAVTAEVGTEASGGGRGAGVSSRRKVIHVKAGRYEESVSISYHQANVMLVGDGKGKTIIDGNKSVAGGYTTWSSATVAAMGAGFTAKGVSIVNSAGPGQGQAVALLVSGDCSVVYQCEVKGHQDTLFAHSNRQLYAYCDVSGTVDFIFGNAAAVLQRCDIQARRPRPGQPDVVTAQGRADPNQDTGFSIHRCRVTGAPDLGADTPVYLGRPWQRYARVAVMATTLDGSVAPAGWLEWSGQPAPGTLYYGEYRNTGAGAVTAGRVTWTGVHTSMSTEDATGFTVANFIMGDSWLDATGVKYTSGL